MSRRFLSTLLACALAFASVVPAHAAAPKDKCTDGFNIPINATSVDQGAFIGNLRITRFARSGDMVVAVGLLTGTLTDETGRSHTYKAGDSYFIRQGQVIIWEVKGKQVIKSFFNVVEPQ